ncbi:MAG: L-seryl-tRNA(Sec) selenium transferase [Candidatus Eremiobacteraeota bacterium]|nr:L-seryl-tRNA(Sec) selenium transferase [Candidatus Eremiobacteraeota bacterium]
MTLRDLPAVHRLLEEPSLRAHAATVGPAAVKAAIAAVLDDARTAVTRGGTVPSAASLAADASERLSLAESDGLLDVLNGTGVLLHTNLGRAPLAAEALAAVERISGGYSNLEFDLEGGTRGSRHARVTALLREATGAEDALVVNNCAAAVLLAIDALAKDGEVIVARGQLVEIGGGMRLPDMVTRTGATLVEVGTTNRVYVADYERALTPRTALLLRSHTSNFRVEGFTADVAPRELAELGKRVGIATFEDLGSGALVDLTPFGLPREATVQESVAAGLDLIAFSGDKLLGGPQAGILVGRTSILARLRSNPFLRAVRVDKAMLAALGATLQLYGRPGGLARIPFYAMLAQTVEALRVRAGAVLAALGAQAPAVRVVESSAFAGGGTLPQAELPSLALALHSHGGTGGALAKRLRTLRPPLVGRAVGDEIWIDLRTILPAQDAALTVALRVALDITAE